MVPTFIYPLSILLLVLAFLPLSAQKATVMNSRRVKSTTMGQEMKYSIYLPKGYRYSQKRFPVVYLLHGQGGNETGWMKYGKVDSVINKLTADKAIAEMIVVMPDGRNDYYLNTFDGKVRYEDYFIKELMPFIDSTYRTKPDRLSRAIVGVSMGGFGATLYGLKNTDKFSTVVGLSAAVRTDSMFVDMENGYYDARFEGKFGSKLRGQDRLNPYFQKNSIFKLMEILPVAILKNTRWYFDCGDDDGFSEGNCALHLLMAKRQIPHEYRVRDGGHDMDYAKSALPDVLKFVSLGFK
jgi:S-formylglutathione hydrolase FrmB